MGEIVQLPVPYWLIHDGYVGPNLITICERCLEEADEEHVCNG